MFDIELLYEILQLRVVTRLIEWYSVLLAISYAIFYLGVLTTN